MMFGELVVGDVVQVMHSNNTMELEVIGDVAPCDGRVRLTFKTTDIVVDALPNESIYFDECNDVVLFTSKHKLINH